MAVQAQDLRAAGLALRARTRGLREADVTDAAGRDGPLVLSWTLRGTRHLHLVEDLRWILSVVGPRFAAGGPARNRQLGIDGAAGETAVRKLRTALGHGPLTRDDVKDVLARIGVDRSGQAPIHVVRRAALAGVLCVVPEPDGGETYVAFEDRVPAGSVVDPEAAAAELARRFLRGYGPASPEDLSAWAGLPRRDAERAWSSVAQELVEIPGAGRRWWALRRSRRAVTSAIGRPAPVRLLPAFDSMLLGYADRGVLVPATHARLVNAGGGMIRPTLLTDRGVIGTWSLERRREVTVAPFGRVPSDIRPALERERADVARFLSRGG